MFAKKYLVRSPKAMLAKSTKHSIYVIDSSKYARLKNCPSTISVSGADTFLKELCDIRITFACVNDNSFWEGDSKYNQLSQLFAGHVIPDISGFTRFELDELG